MTPKEFIEEQNSLREELFNVMLDFIQDLPCGIEAIQGRMSMPVEEFHILMEDYG